MGAVADRRAAAEKAGMSLKEYKELEAAGIAPTSAASSEKMSVADRRAAADALDMSMSEYKTAYPEHSGSTNRDAVNQNISNTQDYDYNAFREGSVNSSELTAMRNQGFSRDEIEQSVNASGLEVGGAAQRKMDRWAEAKDRASKVMPVQNPAQPTKTTQPPATDTLPPTPGGGYGGYTPPSFGSFDPIPTPNTPTFPTPSIGGSGSNPTIPNFDGSWSSGDIDANIGKDGDMTTTIGDNNTIGAGSSIGNDYSVTIGNQSFGNNNSGALTGGYSSAGGPFGGNSNPLSSMQQAAAYGALNDNAWARSQSQLNGYGRAAGASQEAARITGSQDRVANLYNFAGQSQNYWNQKATAQQGFYLGDMFNFQAPEWIMPEAPEKPEDKTEEIANSLQF